MGSLHPVPVDRLWDGDELLHVEDPGLGAGASSDGKGAQYPAPTGKREGHPDLGQILAVRSRRVRVGRDGSPATGAVARACKLTL